MPDSLAKGLGEVPAKDVATFAKAATDQAAQWIKRIGVTPGAGTLSFAKTLLKVSYSSDQRSRTGIFILIASGGKAFIDPISNKIIASDVDTLIKLHLQQEAPDKRTTLSEYLELLLADKVKSPHQFGGPPTIITRSMLDDTGLERFISIAHVDPRALDAVNNALYTALLDKIVVGERPREELMRLADGTAGNKPGSPTATSLLVAVYAKVANADPELQEQIHVELGRGPLLASGFGQENEQVFAEFKERLHAVMWLNERRSHNPKSHHELHLLLLEFVHKALDASTRSRILRESEALLAARRLQAVLLRMRVARGGLKTAAGVVAVSTRRCAGRRARPSQDRGRSS